MSFDVTTIVPAASNATPTRPGPDSTSSGAPDGGTRYSPLAPASASTTNRVPPGSNASPCGRPNLAYRVVTVPSGAMRYSSSQVDSVGPVT